MDKKIIIVFAVVVVLGLAALVFLGDESVVEEPEYTLENAENIALEWVENNSPTYLYDGTDLEIESSQEIDEGFVFEVILSFTSTSAGYGDRDGEMTAQVMTPHTLEVTVEGGDVVSAVNDGVFDEMTGEFIEEDVVVDEEDMEISIYLVEVVNGQEEIVEVTRNIDYTVETGRSAIEKLLSGPTTEEEEDGLSTAIPEGTELIDIDIADGVATVNFSEELHQDVAGSAWVTNIRDQIEQTLMQFETVDDVVISINGETEDILQP